MVRVKWHDELLDVRRVVVRSDARVELQQTLIPMAQRFGLEVADEKEAPEAGDFWIGCAPPEGSDRSSEIGQASEPEVPVAILALISGRYGFAQKQRSASN